MDRSEPCLHAPLPTFASQAPLCCFRADSSSFNNVNYSLEKNTCGEEERSIARRVRWARLQAPCSCVPRPANVFEQQGCSLAGCVKNEDK
jgi:hypothetical protein